MKETETQRAERLQQAREAAAEALYDKYETWNDRGFLNVDKPFQCSTHNEYPCVICHPKKKKTCPDG